MLERLRKRRTKLERGPREPAILRLRLRALRRIAGQKRFQHAQALDVEYAQRLQAIRIETPPVADVRQHGAEARLRLLGRALGQAAREDARGVERRQRIEARVGLRCACVEHRASPAAAFR